LRIEDLIVTAKKKYFFPPRCRGAETEKRTESSEGASTPIEKLLIPGYILMA